MHSEQLSAAMMETKNGSKILVEKPENKTSFGI
jgi:hypothetical protein